MRCHTPAKVRQKCECLPIELLAQRLLVGENVSLLAGLSSGEGELTLERHIEERGLAYMLMTCAIHTFADEARDPLAGLHQIPVALGEVDLDRATILLPSVAGEKHLTRSPSLSCLGRVELVRLRLGHQCDSEEEIKKADFLGVVDCNLFDPNLLKVFVIADDDGGEFTSLGVGE